jgi:tetratricopeptide (TPR) repeat protein
LAAAQAGDPAQARTLLDALLQKNPRDDEAWLLLAGLIDSQDQALAYLSRALVVNPANERARAGIAWIHEARLQAEAEIRAQIRECLHRGQNYLNRGQVDAAAWEFEAAIRKFPDAAELHANVAVVYYEQSRWSEAVRELETAVRLQPDYVDAHYSLGVLQEAMGDQTRALEAWERVLQLDPDHAEARRRLIQYGWSPPEAEPEPDTFFMLCPYCDGEITEQTPSCPHCQRTLFHVCPGCQAMVDKDQRFCPSCHEIISPPERRSVLDHLEPGQSLLSTLRRIEAEARPTKSEEETQPRRRRLRPKMLALLLPVLAFWVLGILAGALGLAFGIDPSWLPTDLYGLGRASQAFTAPLPIFLLSRQLVRYAPFPMILLGLLMLSSTAMRVKWAFFANLILPGVLLLFSLVDMFTGEQTAVALVRVVLTAGVIALTMLAANEYEEGELAQRIAASPRDASLYYNRGLIYYKRGQLDEAIAEWYQAISLNPSDLPTRNLLGLALAERGRFKDALEQLEIAQRMDPEDATILSSIRDVQDIIRQQESET